MAIAALRERERATKRERERERTKKYETKNKGGGPTARETREGQARGTQRKEEESGEAGEARGLTECPCVRSFLGKWFRV